MRNSNNSPLRVSCRGFTLIEVLIVILIISIVTSVATLSIHFNRNKQLETLSRQLVNAINLAEEEALLNSTIIGIGFSNQGWQFYRYQEQTHSWALLNDKALHSPPVPEYSQFSLKIQNKDVPIDGKPRLVISSNGDIPAFTIGIGKSDAEPLYQIIGEEGGNVYVR